MPVSVEAIRSFIQDELSSITGTDRGSFTAETTLIGSGSPLKSRELVELLVAVEEFAEDKIGIQFDWTSDSAMSETRSVYRTIGTLADHLAGLQKALQHS